jgi:TIR domain
VTSPAADTPFDVFLSYHSGDGDWVALLKDRLSSEGVRVWLDSEQIRPGDRYPGVLANAIGQVQSVVVVLSRGSVVSSWVEEEYTLALAQRRRVVAVLIDDVEPPGFLQGRTWVDFRDQAAFEESLEQLIFGITGRSPSGHAGGAPPRYRETAPDQSTDEASVLARLIERRRHERHRLWLARLLSASIGGVLGVAFLFVASEAGLGTRIGVAAAAPSILFLSAWGVTATTLTRLETKLETFETLRDGLEACRSRSHPGCRKIRQHFWNLMERIAADASASRA